MSMLMFNIINILWCLVSRTNNGLVEQNGGFGMIYLLMDVYHMLPQETIQIIPSYSIKDSLIQPQHTCSDPNKYVEVIQQLFTTSPEFHSTKLKKKGILIHGRMYTR